MDLLTAQQIVVKIPESSGGISTESILVFIGGVLAAIAAVAAAIITTRGAASRLAQQLDNERDRFDKQLAAEAERFENQFAQERYLARRAEASSSIEQISRLIARIVSQLGPFLGRYLRDSEASTEQLQILDQRMDELIEGINVLGLRFGNQHSMVWKLLEMVGAIKKAIPNLREVPLSEEKKKELKEAREEVAELNAAFLVEARKAIDEY